MLTGFCIESVCILKQLVLIKYVYGAVLALTFAAKWTLAIDKEFHCWRNFTLHCHHTGNVAISSSPEVGYIALCILC